MHSFILLMDERASLDYGADYVTAHELAHQWFGDLITCRDWSHGWLNEGFATYFEELWGEHSLGKDDFKASMLRLKKGYQAQDAQYRRPIVYHLYHDDGFELFDAHMYNKGGWVLHMLRHQLGEQAFKRAINYYITRNREREVVTSDLERAFEESTGRSLGQFFQQWVYQGGYPEFEVDYNWDSATKMVKVRIRQSQKIDELTPCFVTPVDLAFTLPETEEAAKSPQTTQTRTISMRVIVGQDGQTDETFFFSIERAPLMVRFDPNGWLLKTLKFDLPVQMMRYQLANDQDSLGRIEAAEALVKAADAESLAALKQALLQDPFWGVRAAVAAALGEIATREAQDLLIQGLNELDPKTYSRSRIAIVGALGIFNTQEYGELASRSAEALTALLEQGDPSYLVEAAAAEALGKTRTDGSIETLLKHIERPSWIYLTQRGDFPGLGSTGEDRVVEIMIDYLQDKRRNLMLRLAAAAGLNAVATNRLFYSEEARQRAVSALCIAVEHESWNLGRLVSARALGNFGDARAIPVLEKCIARELDAAVLREMQVVVKKLRAQNIEEEGLKQVRKDLDEVRNENRKLREQLSALENRLK